MNFLRRMMMGRYGSDALNRALLVISIAFIILRWVTGWNFTYYLVLALLVICYFRMFSRNIQARYQENQWFLQRWTPIQQALSDVKTRFSDRKFHRYYKCPSCKKRLRVPKNKGKINISCPYCHTQFIRKT